MVRQLADESLTPRSYEKDRSHSSFKREKRGDKKDENNGNVINVHIRSSFQDDTADFNSSNDDMEYL